MASYDPAQILSQEQISDVINRAKIGSQRQKNEMMRLGTSDPTSFKMTFNKQLQDQASPQDFWGAGRKLASNQTPDQETSDFAGAALPTLGGQRYYYGDKDYSVSENIEKSLLDAGYNTTGGLLDSGLSDLFSGIPTARYHNKDYFKGNFDPNQLLNYKGPKSNQNLDFSGGQWGTQGYTQQDIGGGRYNILDKAGTNIGIGYKNLDDSIKELTSQYVKNHPVYQTDIPEGQLYNPDQELLQQYKPSINSGGDLEKWEILGQLLNDKPVTQNQGRTYDLPGNSSDETIKGLNTLFGSTPLINNNKVVGYKFDSTPIDSSILGYQSPNSLLREDNSGSTRFNQSLAREYNDLDSWKNLVKGIDENSMYVPIENAEQLPGWTNKDINQYSHQDSGAFSKIAQGLGAVLNFTPLAPLGVALSTLGSLQSGNHLGALANVLGSSGIFDKAGGALGDVTGLGADAGKYFVKGGLGSISALGKGGSGALLSGLGAGIGGATGDLLSTNTNNLLGQVGSNILGNSASGALQSLFTKGNPLQEGLTSGISSGLGSFLSTLNNTGDNMDTKRSKAYNNVGKTLVNLIKPKLMKGR